MISQAFREFVVFLVDTGAPEGNESARYHLVVSSRLMEDMVKVPSTSVSRSRWMVELWPRHPMPSLPRGTRVSPPRPELTRLVEVEGEAVHHLGVAHLTQVPQQQEDPGHPSLPTLTCGVCWWE